MNYSKINLHNLYPNLPKSNKDCILECYCRDVSIEMSKQTYPALLICPGGGYQFTSKREGEPIALACLSKGIQSFVLWYTVPHSSYPQYQLEVACALDYISQNSTSLHIQKENISLLGFSAGGHLAVSYTAYYQEFAKKLHCTPYKPKSLVLCYSVITLKEPLTHIGSRDALLKDNTQYIDKLSIESHIGEDFPSTFLWHTALDQTVPVENSIDMAKALTKYHIPFEMHIYPDGAHGLSLSNDLTEKENQITYDYISKWIDLAINFIHRNSK